MAYRYRLLLLAILAGVGGMAFVCRLFALQVAGSGGSRVAAEKQVARWRPIQGRRGRVTDAKGVELAGDEAGYELAVRPAAWRSLMYECPSCGFVRFCGTDLKKQPRCTRCKTELLFVDQRDLAPLARLLGTSVTELAERVESTVQEVEEIVRTSEGELPPSHAKEQRALLWNDYGWRLRRVARDVPYEVAREVELNPHANPAFRIRPVHARRACGGSAFAHILGQVRPKRFYVGDDDRVPVEVDVGVSGLELALDDVLRGEPGCLRIYTDPRDGDRRVVDRRAPRHGQDVRLTIATEDQVRAAAALGAEPAAFVVIDVRDGAVLAAVSAPSYEPQDYAKILARLGEERDRTGHWPRHSALQEAAFRDFNVPGSIVKPVTAVASLLSGVAAPDTHVTCDRFFRNRRGQTLPLMRCSGEHGDVDLHEALVRSCNVYFQTLQREAIERGVFDKFVEVSHRFGFGQATGIEIEPDPYPDTFKLGRTWADNVMTAVGQGQVKLSPAQIARAYAALATGTLPRLHLVAEVGGRAVSPPGTPLAIDERALNIVRAALREVPVRGTAAGHGLERWPLSLKTGTAQLHGKIQNAWLAGFLPAHRGRPPISFAMVVFDTELNGAEACAPRLAEFLRSFYGEGQE